MARETPPSEAKTLGVLLLLSVFVIAVCGLIYELIAGTLASYLLGDSVTQFSTIIGTYLFAMGIGSWLSRYFNKNLLASFVRIEILIGLIGGSSAAMLFMLFEHVVSFRVPLYGIVLVIGILVGVEIPLLLRILKDQLAFKDLVARVFTFDYIGALFAALLFPLVLVPHLGLIRTGMMFGIMNVGVALWVIFRFERDIPWPVSHKTAGILTMIFLVLGFAYSERIMTMAEGGMYPDPVIYASSTPYQRIVITKSQHDLRLFLNNNLQFSARDEYRYHEALVHPGLATITAPKRVLILGGGDGLAAREVLKYPSVEEITLVDLDPAMTRLFSGNELLTTLNANVFASSKIHVINADAFLWLKDHVANKGRPFDFVIADFPDPSNYSIGKLYSLTFYKLLQAALSLEGVAVVQSTSPLVAPQSFWCVAHTLQAAGFKTEPYHAYVPSFGEWGFIMAARRDIVPATAYPAGLRYVTPEVAAFMRLFPADMADRKTEINRLDNQALVRYFDQEWAEYAIN